MNSEQWYAQLIKPEWAPPSWLFGPVWTVLYFLIAVSYLSILRLFLQKKISGKVLLPFVLNLVFNFAFTPLQFGLQNNLLAAIDIILVLGTIIWMFIAIYTHARWIVWVNVPYLLWVSFATVLQLTLTFINW